MFVLLWREGDERGVLLDALVIVRDRNSSQASELDRDSKRGSLSFTGLISKTKPKIIIKFFNYLF